MNQNQQQDAFSEELYKLINRFTDEYDLTVPSIVGVIEVIKLELMMSCIEIDDEN